MAPYAGEITVSPDSVAQDQLQSFVRRIEALEDEINALNSDKSEVYKEAKGNGFDTKVLRKVIADRRKDASERTEFDAVYELYWDAIHGVVRAHVENIEEFPPHDPTTGEIIEPATPRAADRSEARPPAGAPVDQFRPETADGMVGGFPVPAAPSSRGGTGGPGQAENMIDVNAGVQGVTGGESAAPIQPETATQSTAARMDVPFDAMHDASPDFAAARGKTSAEAATKLGAGTQAPPVDASAVVFFHTAADPRCRNPHLCGAHSLLGVCAGCREAAGETVHREAAE